MWTFCRQQQPQALFFLPVKSPSYHSNLNITHDSTRNPFLLILILSHATSNLSAPSQWKFHVSFICLFAHALRQTWLGIFLSSGWCCHCENLWTFPFFPSRGKASLNTARERKKARELNISSDNFSQIESFLEWSAIIFLAEMIKGKKKKWNAGSSCYINFPSFLLAVTRRKFSRWVFLFSGSVTSLDTFSNVYSEIKTGTQNSFTCK